MSIPVFAKIFLFDMLTNLLICYSNFFFFSYEIDRLE